MSKGRQRVSGGNPGVLTWGANRAPFREHNPYGGKPTKLAMRAALAAQWPAGTSLVVLDVFPGESRVCQAAWPDGTTILEPGPALEFPDFKDAIIDIIDCDPYGSPWEQLARIPTLALGHQWGIAYTDGSGTEMKLAAWMPPEMATLAGVRPFRGSQRTSARQRLHVQALRGLAEATGSALRAFRWAEPKYGNTFYATALFARP